MLELLEMHKWKGLENIRGGSWGEWAEVREKLKRITKFLGRGAGQAGGEARMTTLDVLATEAAKSPTCL